MYVSIVGLLRNRRRLYGNHDPAPSSVHNFKLTLTLNLYHLANWWNICGCIACVVHMSFATISIQASIWIFCLLKVDAVEIGIEAL